MITKYAEELMEKRAGITRGMGRGVYNFLRGRFPVEKIKKPAKGLYHAVKKPVEWGVKGTTRAADLIRKYPHSLIPAAGVGLYSAAKLPDQVQRNYLHTDPQMMATRRTATNEHIIPGLASPRIAYADPLRAAQYKNRNFLY